MIDSDFVGVPDRTAKFVLRLHEMGIDRPNMHGLFVMLGLYAGAPRPQSEVEALLGNLNSVLPIDRSRNLDEIVAHVYRGYERELNEFCFRSGVSFEFRQLKQTPIHQAVSIVSPRNEGVLATDVVSAEKMADASNLMNAFTAALGMHTAETGASLIEAFSCGVLQIQLHALSDAEGASFIARIIRLLLPIYQAQCFTTLLGNQIEYFMGLQPGQAALLGLMGSLDESFARQMWGFQSRLFFHDGQPLQGIDDFDAGRWYSWVLDNARQFDLDYPKLVPFSLSGESLSNVPTWGGTISDFSTCDNYISQVWGYRADRLKNAIEHLEYKALTIYVAYASLTSSREDTA